MKNKLKKHSTTLLILTLVIVYLLLISFFGAGFSLNPNVTLSDFTVSQDETEITLKTSVPTPTESIRKYNYIKSGDAYYLDFIYTFGIGPFIFGEKDEFTIKVSEDCKGIFFLRESGYELMLYKNDETNQWEIPQPEITEQ